MSRQPSGARGVAPLVLVVDDDHDFQDCVCALLADAGYRTQKARNGREALELLIAGERPDAVLLDLMMPEIDGATVLREIRGDSATAGVPVVVASASLRNVERVPGASAVLTKPFDGDTLVALLDRLCAPPDAGRATG